jgi:hypothetical protein
MARTAAAAFAVAALAAGGVTQRAGLTASFAVLGHLRWLCIPAAIVLESVSMAAFAIMLRRLLAAGGASVGVRPMLATAYAANAVSVSVPLAGPGLATGFIFRRFTRQGADAPLAGWSLLVGGVASSAAAALVVVGSGLASGKILVAAVAVRHAAERVRKPPRRAHGVTGSNRSPGSAMSATSTCRIFPAAKMSSAARQLCADALIRASLLRAGDAAGHARNPYLAVFFIGADLGDDGFRDPLPRRFVDLLKRRNCE